MMDALKEELRHLEQLLEALQRCAYVLDHSEQKIDWPLEGVTLSSRRKDTGFSVEFDRLSH